MAMTDANDGIIANRADLLGAANALPPPLEFTGWEYLRLCGHTTTAPRILDAESASRLAATRCGWCDTPECPECGEPGGSKHRVVCSHYRGNFGKTRAQVLAEQDC